MSGKTSSVDNVKRTSEGEEDNRMQCGIRWPISWTGRMRSGDTFKIGTGKDSDRSASGRNDAALSPVANIACDGPPRTSDALRKFALREIVYLRCSVRLADAVEVRDFDQQPREALSDGHGRGSQSVPV